LRSAIADNVITHLAARRLDRLVNLAFGNIEAFRDDLEVIDERFHLRLHLLAIGKHNLRRIRLYRTRWQSVERLLHHANRLAQLLYSTHIPVEYIAILAERHF